jgi:hypothetical protein
MPKKTGDLLIVLSMMVVGFSLLAEAQQAIKVGIIQLPGNPGKID